MTVQIGFNQLSEPQRYKILSERLIAEHAETHRREAQGLPTGEHSRAEVFGHVDAMTARRGNDPKYKAALDFAYSLMEKDQGTEAKAQAQAQGLEITSQNFGDYDHAVVRDENGELQVESTPNAEKMAAHKEKPAEAATDSSAASNEGLGAKDFQEAIKGRPETEQRGMLDEFKWDKNNPYAPK